MKVKIFSRPWSRDLGNDLEREVNEFLAALLPGAVKHIDTDIVAARAESGEVKSEIIMTIWYEEPTPNPAREPTDGDTQDEVEATAETAAGLDNPAQFPKIRS
jgi:hypothetical protein